MALPYIGEISTITNGISTIQSQYSQYFPGGEFPNVDIQNYTTLLSSNISTFNTNSGNMINNATATTGILSNKGMACGLRTLLEADAAFGKAMEALNAISSGGALYGITSQIANMINQTLTENQLVSALLAASTAATDKLSQLNSLVTAFDAQTLLQQTILQSVGLVAGAIACGVESFSALDSVKSIFAEKNTLVSDAINAVNEVKAIPNVATTQLSNLAIEKIIANSGYDTAINNSVSSLNSLTTTFLSIV